MREADPVLHRAAGVQVLELREDRPGHVRGDPVEPDNRRRPDEVEDARILARHRGRKRTRSSGASLLGARGARTIGRVADGESRAEKLDRELKELTDELRVALPGVQVLFAFLLTVPFTNRFEDVSELQRDAFFLSFLCATASSICLIAPSVMHRIQWRQHDKERLLRIANTLALVGATFSPSRSRASSLPDHGHALRRDVGCRDRRRGRRARDRALVRAPAVDARDRSRRRRRG